MVSIEYTIDYPVRVPACMVREAKHRLGSQVTTEHGKYWSYRYH